MVYSIRGGTITWKVGWQAHKFFKQIVHYSKWAKLMYYWPFHLLKSWWANAHPAHPVPPPLSMDYEEHWHGFFLVIASSQDPYPFAKLRQMHLKSVLQQRGEYCFFRIVNFLSLFLVLSISFYSNPCKRYKRNHGLFDTLLPPLCLENFCIDATALLTSVDRI